MQRLTNKVAIVTGAAGGIGAGIAQRFAREGACVGVLDLSVESYQKVIEAINATGGEAIALGVDVGDEARSTPRSPTCALPLGRSSCSPIMRL